MLPLFYFKCDKCNFCLPEWWDQFDQGIIIHGIGETGPDKIGLDNTGFDSTSKNINHPNPWVDLMTRSVMQDDASQMDDFRITDCLCLSCMHQFALVFPLEDEEERKCPSCSSTNIKTSDELVGQPCPSCKKGLIRPIKMKRW